MGSWAERMIAQEVAEKSIIRQEETALQNKIAQEKKHKANTLAMRLFHVRHIDSESFFRFIAYAYFVCKTLGLLLLIGLLFLGKLHTILFILIFLGCYILNLKFCSRRR